MAEYIKGLDDKFYKVYFSGSDPLAGKGDGFKVNNWAGLNRGTEEQLLAAIQHFLQTGDIPVAGDIGTGIGKDFDNVMGDFNKWREANGLQDDNYFQKYKEGAEPVDSKGDAFNTYYKDLYRPDVEGTSGNQMLRDLEGVYEREANTNKMMADIQFKDAAMQQAATVKQITDQVRNERMARLKSGMSEAQIANQDMQQMMTNVNTLSQNQQMLGQQRMQAAGAQDTAKDQAYMDYLNQANARGQNAAAFSAADAGNADFMTKQRMKETGEPYEVANAWVTTGAAPVTTK